MKILMLTHRFKPAIGGVETHVFEIAKNLKNMGHDVTIFTSNLESIGSGKKLSEKYHHHFIEGIEIYRFNAYQLVPSIDAGCIIPSMLTRAIFDAKKFDIVHAHSYAYFSSLCGALVKILTKTPVVFTPHFAAETVVSKKIKKIYDIILGKFTFKHCDKLILLTKIEKEEIQKIIKIENDKIDIIPNGVDLDKFKIKYDSDKFRATYKIEKSDKIILSVCRIAENKGLQYLMDAAPKIIKKVPNVKFVMIGKDWGMKDKLIEIAKKNNFLNKIIFPGKLTSEEMIKFYEDSDVFALPSIGGEAFGIVILEAMAAGKPVVASNIGGIPCVLRDSRNGFLTLPKDSHALAQQITKLLTNKTLYNEISKNNLEEIRKYSWKNITQKIQTVYRTLEDNKKC
jgi:glycosyltransferase involved in cell wall biosynthesis